MRDKLGFEENEIKELKARFLKFDSLDADALKEQEDKEAMAAMNWFWSLIDALIVGI